MICKFFSQLSPISLMPRLLTMPPQSLRGCVLGREVLQLKMQSTITSWSLFQDWTIKGDFCAHFRSISIELRDCSLVK